MSIRITTLGTLRVTQGDRILSALPAQRLRAALLVHLAVVRETTRDALLGMFWPERTEDKARHALSQNIYELRRVLGDNWIDVRGERIAVARDVSVDVVAFDEAVERGDFAGGLSLYRGQFLDGFYLPDSHAFGAWVDAQRMKTQRQHRRARREHIRQLVDLARMREATVSAREWVAIDPTDDEGQHRLIELLADAGDRAGAIRQYEAYERLLRQDDLVPLEETRNLVERIRGGSVGDLPGIPVRAISTPATSTPPPAAPAAAAPAPSLPVAGMSATPAQKPRPRAAVIAVLAFAVIAITSAWLWASRTNTPERPDPARVAVLYFQDRSETPLDDDLAASITEALIADFGNIDTTMLVVRSASAVSRFRREPDAAQVARALDVDLIVEGVVARVGDRVRVRASLVNAESGAVLATVPQLEREYVDRFELIDDVASYIGTRLRREIGIVVEAGRRRTPAQRDVYYAIVESRRIADAALHDITRGEHARARSELATADSLLALAENIDRDDVDAILERARLAESRGLLDLDAEGPVGVRRWMDTLEAHARRALEVDPRNAAALEMLGVAYHRRAGFADLGAIEEARALTIAQRELTAALNIDPRRPLAAARLASVYYRQHQYDRAIEQGRRALAVDPYAREASESLNIIALSLFEKGRDADALRTCREGRSRFANSPTFVLCELWVSAFGTLEIHPDSAWRLAALVPHSSTDRLTTRPALDMMVAFILARGGHADSAIAVLDRAALQPTSSSMVGWVEPAARAIAGQTARAVEMMRADARINGPVMTNSRVMYHVTRDPALRRALRTDVAGPGA